MNISAPLPEKIFEAGSNLYRITFRNNDPIVYRHGNGRFNSNANAPRYGVCYFGLEPLACFVEKFGRMDEIGIIKPIDYTIYQFSLIAPRTLVDLPDPTNLGNLGITSAVYSERNYFESQGLADKLFTAGYEGISYILRHGLGMHYIGVALFGELDRKVETLELIDRKPISEELISEASTKFRLELEVS